MDKINCHGLEWIGQFGLCLTTLSTTNSQAYTNVNHIFFFFFSQQRMRKTNSGGCKMLDLPTNRDESERYISLTIQVKRQHKLILDDPLCLIQPNPILKMANNTRHFARRTRKKTHFFLNLSARKLRTNRSMEIHAAASAFIHADFFFVFVRWQRRHGGWFKRIPLRFFFPILRSLSLCYK